MVEPTTVAALAVRSVIPRFVAGLAAGAAAAGIIIAFVIGSTPIRVGAGVAVIAALAVVVVRSMTLHLEVLDDHAPERWEPSHWPQLPGEPAEAPPPAPAGPVGPTALVAALAAPPRREVPYWLQLTSVGVGIVSGIGGMIIALIK